MLKISTNPKTSLLLTLFLIPMISESSFAITVSSFSNGSRQSYVDSITTQTVSIDSQEKLDEIIDKLNHPETRLKALSQLCQFAQHKVYQVGSLIHIASSFHIDDLQKQAAEAVKRQINIETISQALDSSDAILQFWAIFFWRTGIYEPPSPEIDAWLSLIPKVKRLAVEGEEHIRSTAIRKLKQCKGTEFFLAERMEFETSPYVVEELARRGEAREFSKRFNPLLLKLLFHPDEDIRIKSLSLIGSNSMRAQSLQIAFDMNIYDRVFELTYSSSIPERSIAAYALTDIRRLNPDQSRDAFVRLSQDVSSEVRWRAGFAIAREFDREDIKPIIAALLNDPSPLVRLMTIVGGGPEHFVKELKELTKSPDRKTAESAADLLKRLAQDGKLPDGAR